MPKEQKTAFIPLKAEYFLGKLEHAEQQAQALEAKGQKPETVTINERRKYGGQWREHNFPADGSKEATISFGYGTELRVTGTVVGFEQQTAEKGGKEFVKEEKWRSRIGLSRRDIKEQSQDAITSLANNSPQGIAKISIEVSIKDVREILEEVRNHKLCSQKSLNPETRAHPRVASSGSTRGRG